MITGQALTGVLPRSAAAQPAAGPEAAGDAAGVAGQPAPGQDPLPCRARPGQQQNAGEPGPPRARRVTLSGCSRPLSLTCAGDPDSAGWGQEAARARGLSCTQLHARDTGLPCVLVPCDFYVPWCRQPCAESSVEGQVTRSVCDRARHRQGRFSSSEGPGFFFFN